MITMVVSKGIKSVASKMLASASGWFAAGSFYEAAMQYGLTVKKKGQVFHYYI